MRVRRPARLLALGAVAVALLGVAGCGGDDDEGIAPRVPTANFADSVTGSERAPALAAQGYINATNKGDGDALCDLTSKTEQDFRECKKVIESTFDAFNQVEYELISVKVGPPGQAEVRLRQTKPKLKPSDPQTTLFKLIEVDGEWKVNVFTTI